MKERILVAMLALFCCASANAWWNDAWSFRKQVEFDPAQNGSVPAAIAGEAPILLRLHSGNFAYFMDVLPQGGDLRFVAGDDETPLPHYIEAIDTIAGFANIWVRVPPASAGRFYMYYGNPEARSGESPQQFWTADDLLIYHFRETSGGPQDATAFRHHPARSDLALGMPGLIGGGAELSGSNGLELLPTDLLSLSANGFTVSAWIRPTTRVAAGRLVTQQGVVLGVDQGFPYAVVGDLSLRTATPIPENQWQHLALSHSRERTQLLLDGIVVAEGTPAEFTGATGPLEIGSQEAEDGFIGGIDELRIARVALSAEYLGLQARSQREDSMLLTLGEDESREAGESAFFALFWTMLDAVGLEGWVVLALIGILGFVSFDVLISKSFELSRAERDDAAFLKGWKEQAARASDLSNLSLDGHAGPLARLFQSFQAELAGVRQQMEGLPPAGPEIEAVRAGLDSAITEAAEQFNRKVVLVTMAVSGGPFLGLLGTVVGVMITFASIAAAGEVNVRTIAPGVAGALITTVMGLVVAIPSLFGYNYVAGRITRRAIALEGFADQLVSRTALAFARESKRKELNHAA